MYKITVVPFTKMLNFQSAFMPSSWPQKNNAINFPKIYDFCQMEKFGLIVILGKLYLKYMILVIYRFTLRKGHSTDCPGLIKNIK